MSPNLVLDSDEKKEDFRINKMSEYVNLYMNDYEKKIIKCEVATKGVGNRSAVSIYNAEHTLCILFPTHRM